MRERRFSMKNKKKHLSLLLVLVMVLTMVSGFVAKADTSITVTLRVEQDEATRIPPVQVRLTDADKRDFGIGLDTDKLTPLHALAKYMSEKKGATDATMKQYIQASESQYGLFLEGISTDGTSSGSPAAGSQDGVSWMFAVNNTSPSVGVSAYELSDQESLVLYGIWGGGTWPDNAETNYSYFDQSAYTVASGQPLSVRLKGLGYDENYNSITKDLTDASVIAASCTDDSSTATEKNAALTAKTDEKGTASLTFSKAGKYVLSAYRKAEDGTHYNISRPYAVVTVTDTSTALTASPTPSAPTATNTPAAPSITPDQGILPPTVDKAPGKPTSVKAIVKKSKKKKKTVRLTWKKRKGAKGYRIYISQKKNKGFQKLADTKKTTLNFKRKKGTYYIRVKAYIVKADKTRLYSKNSKTLKVKIKK